MFPGDGIAALNDFNSIQSYHGDPDETDHLRLKAYFWLSIMYSREGDNAQAIETAVDILPKLKELRETEKVERLEKLIRASKL